MTPPWVEALVSAVDNLAALLAFFYVLLGSFVMLLLLLLFGSLALRAVWRWLTDTSLNDVVLRAERKAIR